MEGRIEQVWKEASGQQGREILRDLQQVDKGETRSRPDTLLRIGQADSHTVEGRPSAVSYESTGAACPMTLKSYSLLVPGFQASRELCRCSCALLNGDSPASFPSLGTLKDPSEGQRRMGTV